MKVRLKHKDDWPLPSRSEFQFHEGPIKTQSPLQIACKAAEFQFHEGPIKTGLKKGRDEGFAEFQFHEGPIKTL